MKRPFPGMSLSDLDRLKKELTEMLEAGIIISAMHSRAESPSSSGWCFQVMYVPKKGGDKRLVVLFQDLNKVTIRDPWPFPVITNFLEFFRRLIFEKDFMLLVSTKLVCQN